VIGGWHFVGDRASLEGVCATPCAIGDVPLILARDGDRTRALSNVCTHRGALLLDGPTSARSIRCPYHGRRFGLDGSIVVAPGFDTIPDEPLPEVPLVSFGPLYFASLDRTPLDLSPLHARFSFLPLDTMRHDPASDRTFEIDARWTMWCENYLEGLHIPYVHPKLARTLDLDRYSIETFADVSLQIGEAAKHEACFVLPDDHPDAGRRIAGYYAFVLPATALNFYPWGLSLNVVRPLGPARTRIEYRAYVIDEELREHGAGAGLDDVEAEDDTIVERVERGMKSPLYRPGKLSPAHERAVSWFRDRCAALG
jgi:choline monooxygenase